MNINQDTICAIATAQGGAIGIIRVSGPKAIDHTAAIFRPIQDNLHFLKQKAYTLTFGKIVNEHGEEIGISFPEEAIHLMPYDTTMNLYEGTIVDETTADFGAFTLAIDLKNLYEGSHLGASGHLVNAEQKPIDWNGQRVSLNFNPADGDLSDDENAGFVCGNIDTIIYVGDHYMYIVRGDQDEEYYVDDEWLWNAGDRVSIVVPGDKLKLQLL